jgi:hypothetical protein
MSHINVGSCPCNDVFVCPCIFERCHIFSGCSQRKGARTAGKLCPSVYIQNIIPVAYYMTARKICREGGGVEPERRLEGQWVENTNMTDFICSL